MAKKKHRKNSKEKMVNRSVALLFVMVLGMAVVGIGRVGWLTIVRGEELREKAENQQLDEIILPASRGTIYDNEMNTLAQSADAWLVHVDPIAMRSDDPDATKKKDEAIIGLSEILGIDKVEIRNKIDANSNTRYVKIKGGVEYAEKELLEKYIVKKDIGQLIGIDPDSKRYYPNGRLASTVLGFTGDGGRGLYGIEYYYNDELTGTDGRIISAFDGVKNALEDCWYKTTDDPVNGTDLVLTVNLEIQNILENALISAYESNGAKNVYGIVMDTNTGAILAEANFPTFDANSPYTITDERILAEIESLSTDEEKTEKRSTALNNMWKNRAIADFYYPGSVFKVFLVSAAFEEGVIDENTTYTCTGFIDAAGRKTKDFSPYGHGTQTPRELLVNSCNTFSVTVGQRLGMELFYKYYEAFGFTEKTGIDMLGENTPIAGIAYHEYPGSFTNSDLVSASFGQSNSVSPMQIITAISAIGNGGNLMKPYIVAKKLDGNGNTIAETVPNIRRQVISKKTASLVASYMKDVVADPSGTGRNAYVPGYHVAGKTGTSEKINPETRETDGYLASFAGFAPYDDPVISVLVVVDDPSGGNYSGGVIAAPVAGEVFEKSLKYLGVTPNYSEDETPPNEISTPEFEGLDIEAAREKAQSAGLRVRVMGDGSSVIAQCPTVGRSIVSDGIVILYTEKENTRETVEVPNFSGLSISQANAVAAERGLNLRVAGRPYVTTDAESYKQDPEYGTEVAIGSFVDVYFRTYLGTRD